MIEAILLARIQFAANITFHILFPTITIALGWLLFYFRIKYHQTRQKRWTEAYHFWVKVFALSFALGVVSGITMSFQFGTNWPGFMESVGNIAGPLLAYEVLTAFFLEATFLGIMLFGAQRVSPKIHSLATLLVAVSTTLSAFWIMVLNAWMQTPAGFEMINGKAIATSWWDIIFNPSMHYRLIHMLMASALTAAFLMIGISAYRWRKGDRSNGVKAALSTGIVLAAIMAPAQILSGDLLGLNTLKHQPQKIAAMEGVWETQKGAPFLIFAIPNEEEQKNDFAIGIPKLASLILTHDLDGEIKGLSSFEKAPPMTPVFWSFRIMLATGMLMLLTAGLGVFYWFKRQQNLPDWLCQLFVWMSFSGWVGTVSGWYVSEIGRQPYLVDGVLLTADAVSTTPASMVSLSLAFYLLTYPLLVFAYISTLFFLAKKAINPSPRPNKPLTEEPAHA